MGWEWDKGHFLITSFFKEPLPPSTPWNFPAKTPSQVLTNQISPCLSWQPQGGSTLITCGDNAPLLELCLISLSFTAVITTGAWWLNIPTLATDKLNLHTATFLSEFLSRYQMKHPPDITSHPHTCTSCWRYILSRTKTTKRRTKSPVENAGTNVLCSHFAGWAAILQYSNYCWISN